MNPIARNIFIKVSAHKRSKVRYDAALLKYLPVGAVPRVLIEKIRTRCLVNLTREVSVVK